MAKNTEEKINLPLSKTVLAILVALTGRKLHGYELKKLLAEEFCYKIPTGTLYRNLANMLESGLIDECEGPPHDDERRRYYTTTGLGERAKTAEMDSMRKIVEADTGGLVWKS